ncbi:L-asparaginase 1, partial [Francisella tularensis subsp. holarctica]|nr:L-asparaginase 1 [Francisella tularensis subsp. holarctica]
FAVTIIAILSVFTGMGNYILEAVLEPQLQGLILKTYGAGNMINDPSIHMTQKKANYRGVEIVKCTQCLYGSVKIESYKTPRG